MSDQRKLSKNAPSILCKDLQVIGQITSTGDIQIDGIVDGDIETKLLTVGETATVNGSIEGEVIRVAGIVNGEITGRIVELTKSARITGDINHHSLAIEAGAWNGFFRLKAKIDDVTAKRQCVI